MTNTAVATSIGVPGFSDLPDDLPERVDFPNFFYPNLPRTSCTIIETLKRRPGMVASVDTTPHAMT